MPMPTMPTTGLEPLDVAVQIPYHFRCPISLELMRDPVTLTTGQTYDRSSIESWVATGNTTCPVTRSVLPDFSLIPNHTLRRLIQEWCVANVSFGVHRIPTPKQPADPVTLHSILTQASSDSSSSQSRISAIRQLRTLACESEKNRSLISSLQASGILLRILFADLQLESSELSYESLATLTFFPLSESECVSVASDVNRMAYIVSFLSDTSLDVRVNSAALIENVFSGTTSPELRSQISNTDGIYQGIIGILKSPQAYPRAVKFGIKALFSLCLNKQHRHKAVASGAVETLIDRLTELERCDAERALATVELLCRLPVGCAAFADHDLTVPLLVKIILKISDRATEYAAGALLSVCTSSERCQKEAVRAGVLTQLLLLVQSDCTARAKRKAQTLLKLLRDSWADDGLSNTHQVACSQVVPF